MTNPDNVGGLPDGMVMVQRSDAMRLAMFVEPLLTGGAVQLSAMRIAELCRAAPAGGDDFLAKLEARIASEKNKARRWALICFRDSIVSGVEPDSAPAGSGEDMAKCLEAIAEVREPLHGWHRGTLHKAAALLRKLQQGAE